MLDTNYDGQTRKIIALRYICKYRAVRKYSRVSIRKTLEEKIAELGRYGRIVGSYGEGTHWNLISTLNEGKWKSCG